MFRRRHIVWLVALVVAIRALMPPGFMPSSTSLANGLMTVVICSSSGLKLMRVDRDGQPVERQEHSTSEEPCSYGPPSVAAPASAPINVAVAQRSSRIAHSRIAAFSSANRHRAFRLAREPPFSA